MAEKRRSNRKNFGVPPMRFGATNELPRTPIHNEEQNLRRTMSERSVRSKATSERSLQLRDELHEKCSVIDDEVEKIEQQQLELKKKRLLEKKSQIREEYERKIDETELENEKSSQFESIVDSTERTKDWINGVGSLRGSKSFTNQGILRQDTNEIFVSPFVPSKEVHDVRPDDNNRSGNTLAPLTYNNRPGTTFGPSTSNNNRPGITFGPSTFDNNRQGIAFGPSTSDNNRHDITLAPSTSNNNRNEGLIPPTSNYREFVPFTSNYNRNDKDFVPFTSNENRNDKNFVPFTSNINRNDRNFVPFTSNNNRNGMNFANSNNAAVFNDGPKFGHNHHEYAPYLSNNGYNNQPPSVTNNDILLAAFNALKDKKVKDLPIFNGDQILEFPNFLAEFERSTEEYRINHRENLRRLNKAIQGTARKSIQTLLYNDVNVPKIIETLKMNFGRKEWIVVKLMNKLRSFPIIKEENVTNFRDFYNEISAVINGLQNLNALNFMDSPDLLWCLEEKLPSTTRSIWNRQKAQEIRRGKTVNIIDFGNWFAEELDAQFAGMSLKDLLKKTEPPKEKRPGNVFHVDNVKRPGNDNKRIWCVHCNTKTDHNITKCKKFYGLPVDDRRKLVLEKRLCFACLRKGHGTDTCTEKEKYKCTKCNKFHNELVHPEDSGTVGCMNTREALLKIAKVRVEGANGVSRTVHAFFDDGATISLMEESLAKELGLSGEKTSITYKWVKDIVRTEHNSQTVCLKISQVHDSAKIYDLVGVRTVKGLSLPTQKIDVEEVSKAHPYVERSLLEEVGNVRPLILIGSNNGGLTVPLKTIQRKINGLQVCKSRLGWTVHGSTNSEIISEAFTMAVDIVSEEKFSLDDKKLMEIATKTYELENFGTHDANETISEEDARAVEMMKSTLKKTDDRYEIGHIYRYSNIKFPTEESKNMALRRLSFIERKMDSDAAFAKAYIDKIDDYLQKGYASKLSDDEKIETSNTFYLPHFGVYNPNKPGKFRMVMDAKAKAGNFSLNDLLLKGPDFVPSLLAILWRARLYPWFVSADIREMFHQVLIRMQDRNSQRFLFRGMRRDGDPDIYVMNAMIFGAVSSPSVAQFVKNENAKLLESEFPGITRAIEEQHYVDDYFDSFSTEEEAIEAIHNVMKAHKRGGFELVKWISNSKSVIESIDDELLLPDHDKQETIRVLGLLLNLTTDRFIHNLNLEKLDKRILDGELVPTKRQILCFMMGIFDPIGSLGPLVIKLKIIFQDLWRQNLKWDQKLSDENFLQWKMWLDEAKRIECVEIPRCYLPISCSYENATLHIFCDASDKAYSVVVYLRVVVGNQIYTAFVHGKARVAPLKKLSVPRLELQGAITAALIANAICNELHIDIKERHFWCDSKVVLSWINTNEELASYVGNRVGKILAVSTREEWKWIPTQHNTADLATKLSNKVDLSTKSKWFSGPEFLLLPENEWPSFATPPLDQQEFCLFTGELVHGIHLYTKETIQEICLIADVTISSDVLNADRFSDYIRLIRSTAFVLKMIRTLKQKKQDRPTKFFIDLSNIYDAKEIWVKKVQCDSYYEELQQLRATNLVPKSSKLYQLSPFIDEKGIIRMKGRIPGYNPIILDQKHRFTFLLTNWIHELNLHSGIETVVSKLREDYWIPQCRTLVKKVFNRCVTCKMLRPKVKTVQMGNLPKERCEPCQYPFTFTGLDYFGPITVKYGRRYEKIYGALFTCMTTRGIHVELVSKLDTNCALMAIIRFANMRGVPQKIYSDNATCFRGANNELSKLRAELNDDKIRDKLSLKNIQWCFNPPAAPNFGGVYERMVKSVKDGLKASLKTEFPSYEMLSTALSEIVNTVNSRPLTYVSMNPDDCKPITPNDIILLRENFTNLNTDTEVNYNPKKTWKNAQRIADLFWKQWISCYRPTLLKRSKWHDNRTDPYLKEGDFVIIVDENEIRGKFVKGVIIKTYPGKDGLVRVADIKTKNGVMKRSVGKICKLSGPLEDVQASVAFLNC